MHELSPHHENKCSGVLPPPPKLGQRPAFQGDRFPCLQSPPVTTMAMDGPVTEGPRATVFPEKLSLCGGHPPCLSATCSCLNKCSQDSREPQRFNRVSCTLGKHVPTKRMPCIHGAGEATEKGCWGSQPTKWKLCVQGARVPVRSDTSKCFQAELDTSRAPSLGVCHKPGVLTSKAILGPHQLGGYHDYHADHGSIEAQG